MSLLPERKGIPLRAVVPNAVTALALCVGLSGVRFAIAGEWDRAIVAIVVAGQRVGLIRFGSRVDVYLPAGTWSQVLLGQRTIAGETIIARLGVAELIEGVAQ